MSQKRWVFDPDRGGVKISEAVKRHTEESLRRYAESRFAGRYTLLDIRFRGQFCCIDAYKEPEPPGPNWPPADCLESREAYEVGFAASNLDFHSYGGYGEAYPPFSFFYARFQYQHGIRW